MRADVRGPTTRFRRHCGRQGNRRQRLSSAVAGGPARGRGWGRPLPHFSAEAGQRHTPALASATRGRPPLIDPQSPEGRVAVGRGAAIGVFRGWPCSPGQNTTTTALRAKAPRLALARIPIILVKTTQPFLLWPLHLLPTPRTEASHCQEPRNPLSSVPYFSIHSPPPPPPPHTPIRSRHTLL